MFTVDSEAVAALLGEQAADATFPTRRVSLMSLIVTGAYKYLQGASHDRGLWQRVHQFGSCAFGLSNGTYRIAIGGDDHAAQQFARLVELTCNRGLSAEVVATRDDIHARLSQRSAADASGRSDGQLQASRASHQADVQQMDRLEQLVSNEVRCTAAILSSVDIPVPEGDDDDDWGELYHGV